MALAKKKVHDVVVLLGSTTKAEAGTFTGSSVRMPLPPNGMVFVLDVTTVATFASDKLDVTVQTRIDNAAAVGTWHDVVQFTQVLGNGGTKQYVEKITSAAIEAGYESGTALAAGTVRNIIGDEWRVQYTLTDASESMSFTFSVTACPM